MPVSNFTVSVIIPFYNREAYIAQAIQSVIDQTYRDWELILVDDGSTDNSVSIVKEFIKADERIHLFYRTNEPKGPSACRNIGAKKAIGKYLVFLDSDDFIASFCLEKRTEAMNENPQLDLGIFNLTFFNNAEVVEQYLFNKNAANPKAFLKWFFKLQPPWATPCPIWKRSFFLSTGGFNEEFLVATDPELHTRVLLLHEPLFKYFEKTEADCFYRLHEDEAKLQYIHHAVIFYRIKFFQQSYHLILQQAHFPQKELLRALSEGVLAFYKTYFVKGAATYSTEYFDFLKWAFSKKLINRYKFILLYNIGIAKTSSKKFYKDLHVAGILYRFLKSRQYKTQL